MTDDQNVVRLYDLADLVPHPSQPAARTLDTTDLQSSMAKQGQTTPIEVAADGKTVLGGWRRCTAAKALGWTQIKGVPSGKDPGSPAAIDHLVAGNEQSPLTAMELVAVLRGYEQHGIDFRKACRRVGLKSEKARTLSRLAQAPEEVQKAVERYDRGRKDEGLSFSAFAQMQDLSGEAQLEILNSGKQTKAAVRTEAQKRIKGKAEQRLVDDPTSVQAMIAVAHELADRAIALAAWLETAEPDAAGDVRIAYSKGAPEMRCLVEAI